MMRIKLLNPLRMQYLIKNKEKIINIENPFGDGTAPTKLKMLSYQLIYLTENGTLKGVVLNV